MDCLLAHPVPVVAHNSMLDFGHFYTKFIDGTLPDQAAAFKADLHRLLPQ